MPESDDRYTVKIWVNEGDTSAYMEEHWFAARPERETVRLLLEDAKLTFAALYPEAEPDNLALNVSRLRPADGVGTVSVLTADDD